MLNHRDIDFVTFKSGAEDGQNPKSHELPIYSVSDASLGF